MLVSKIKGLESRVQDFEFRVQGISLGFRVYISGLKA